MLENNKSIDFLSSTNNLWKTIFDCFSQNEPNFQLSFNKENNIQLIIKKNILEEEKIQIDEKEIYCNTEELQQAEKILETYCYVKTYADPNDTFLAKKTEKDQIQINTYAIIDSIAEKSKDSLKIIENQKKSQYKNMIALIIKVLRDKIFSEHKTFFNKKGYLIILYKALQKSFFHNLNNFLNNLSKFALEIEKTLNLMLPMSKIQTSMATQSAFSQNPQQFRKF